MKKLNIIPTIGIILTVMFASCEKNEITEPISPCDVENTNHPNADNYQGIIDDLLAGGVPGVSVTIRSPEGVWSKAGGKADLENGTDLTPCHALRAGSMSKTFAATTIMILQDEGVLSIDDKISDYIPSSITDNIENANDVTIKQILGMTSGIMDYLGLESILGILNLANVRLSAEENLKAIYGKPANFRPDEDILYTNANYLLAALVIKYATGKTANEVVQEKIIDRLGLSNTYISTDNPYNLSRSYIDNYGDGFMKDVTEIDNNAVGGEDMLDGGMITCSYDLAYFLESVMHANSISESSLSQMKETRVITEDIGETYSHIKEYGLGLMYLETDFGVAYGHYGNVHGFSGLVFYFPEHDVTVALIINGYSPEIEDLYVSTDIFSHLF